MLAYVRAGGYASPVFYTASIKTNRDSLFRVEIVSSKIKLILTFIRIN